MVEPLDTKAWVLVPVIPTDEMVEAGGRQQVSDRGGPDSIYRAMLSASPPLPVVGADLEAVAWRYLVSDREWESTTEEAKAERLGEIVIVEPLVRKADAASLISSQKQEIERLTAERQHWWETAHEQNSQVLGHEDRAEVAESRVLSLEEALREIVERAKAASSGGVLAALSGLSGMEQIARNALKVNGNG